MEIAPLQLENFFALFLLQNSKMEAPFESASNTDAKSRKVAKSALTKPKKSSSKNAKNSVSTFLSTQPAIPAQPSDDDDMEFERFPLDYGLTPNVITLKNKSKVSAKDAANAMELDGESDDDETILLDPNQFEQPTPVTKLHPSIVSQMASSLSFPAVATHTTTSGLTQKRKVSIPPHRMTPLKRDWIKVYSPLVEELGLQVRMNLKRRWVEMKVRFSHRSLLRVIFTDPLSLYRPPNTLQQLLPSPELPISFPPMHSDSQQKMPSLSFD